MKAPTHGQMAFMCFMYYIVLILAIPHKIRNVCGDDLRAKNYVISVWTSFNPLTPNSDEN